MVTRPLITTLASGKAFPSYLFNWGIDWREQTSGTATSGRVNINLPDFPRWVGSPKYGVHDDDILKFRAMHLAGRGRIGIYRVRLLDPIGFSGNSNSVNFLDNTPFSGGVGFLGRSFVSLVGDVARGADEITVDETAADSPIKVGSIMSFDDYPFAVTWREGSGANVTLGVEMPIRKAMTDGELINLDATGLFEVVENDPAMGAYDANRMTMPQFSFREWMR